MKKKTAKKVVDSLSKGLYNYHLELAKAGHKTIQSHFKDWYGKDWKDAKKV